MKKSTFFIIGIFLFIFLISLSLLYSNNIILRGFVKDKPVYYDSNTYEIKDNKYYFELLLNERPSEFEDALRVCLKRGNMNG